MVFLLYVCFSIWTNIASPSLVAGTKPCNLRLGREKRLLAVRGQILTKLGLTEPPKERNFPNVSEEILQTYRSAVQEKQKLFEKSDTCGTQVKVDEDYFAKRVVKLSLQKQYAKTIASSKYDKLCLSPTVMFH